MTQTRLKRLPLLFLALLASCGGGSDSTPPAIDPPPQVTLNISNGAGVSGTVVITLAPTQAPLTVNNFLAYVNSGFYNGTVFHRYTPGFVAQGGGYAGPLTAGGALPAHKTTNAPIVLEDNAGLSNLRLTVAMARTSAADSATSEFFVNLANNTGLDRTATARGYAVFGSVTTGSEVITAMASATCLGWAAFLPNDGSCLLSPNVTITSAAQTR